MNESHATQGVLWKLGARGWMLLGGVALLFAVLYWEGLRELVKIWDGKEEYSHGFLIPLISLFLVWQKKDELERVKLTGSWIGVPIVLFAILVYFLGDLSTIFLIIHYSMLVFLAGLLLAFGGWRAMGLLWVPLVYLFFMVPLPPFLYNQLSGKLQLISSELGVMVIRAFDISVYLEGNVIDLGKFQLQVVEACNGLRYLFPLMSFGFLCAYLFKVSFWKRAIVFLSTIPLTVLMNSFRIGVIGVLVEYWGIEQAEGFLHDFEGWIIFMACVAILFLEMWLLVKLTGDRRPLSEVFGLEMPMPAGPGATFKAREPSRPVYATLLILLLAIGVAKTLDHRPDVYPARASFASFPMQLDAWHGERVQLDEKVLEALDHPDYLMSNFVSGRDNYVNFYVAYYKSQKTGAAAHSPRACIPGGGWKIQDFTARTIEGVQFAGQPLKVNRLLIQKDDERQLVYYWFKQRERVLTSEYAVKWYLFWDSLTRQRTDGALIRITKVLRPTESLEQADQVLVDFYKLVADRLVEYVPN